MKLIKRSFIYLFLCLSAYALCSEEPVVLVTGGAGYIGSHTCHVLKQSGFCPVAYDSLINGSADAVKWGPLIIGDINDADTLNKTIAHYKPIAVIHFAALRNIGESVLNPYEYYHANVSGTLTLLDAMRKNGVRSIIFSSSCTVYGISQNPIRETAERAPINPYANSKYFVEKILGDFARAYDLKYIVLRYFNAAGVDGEAGLRRLPSSYNFLIPKAIASILEDHPLSIFGTDYPTADGTAVRDYIHVKDLAHAHVLALQHLLNSQTNASINLGTGKGYSVLEILHAIKKIAQKDVPVVLQPRREGDAPEAVADPELAKQILHFSPQHSDLESMVRSEWDYFH